MTVRLLGHIVYPKKSLIKEQLCILICKDEAHTTTEESRRFIVVQHELDKKKQLI
jgi:hypothetical protein